MTTLAQSGFQFEVAVQVQGVSAPVVARGSYPDAIFIQTPPLKEAEAQIVIKALELALAEARLSLTLRAR